MGGSLTFPADMGPRQTPINRLDDPVLLRLYEPPRGSVFVDGHAPSREETAVAIQLADTHTRPLRPGERVTERL